MPVCELSGLSELVPLRLTILWFCQIGHEVVCMQIMIFINYVLFLKMKWF